MYDTAMRVRLVKKRTREIELRKKKNRLQRLSVVCMLLAVSLVYAAVSMPGEPHMEKLEMYGMVLLHEGASGYVLTGVACGDGSSAHEKSPVNQRFLPIWSENRCVFLFP